MAIYDTKRLTDHVAGLMKRAIQIARRDRDKATTQNANWDRMYRAIAAIPSGRWTSIADLAELPTPVRGGLVVSSTASGPAKICIEFSRRMGTLALFHGRRGQIAVMSQLCCVRRVRSTPAVDRQSRQAADVCRAGGLIKPTPTPTWARRWCRDVGRPRQCSRCLPNGSATVETLRLWNGRKATLVALLSLSGLTACDRPKRLMPNRPDLRPQLSTS